MRANVKQFVESYVQCLIDTVATPSDICAIVHKLSKVEYKENRPQFMLNSRKEMAKPKPAPKTW